jgi:hypothetical protein
MVMDLVVRRIIRGNHINRAPENYFPNMDIPKKNIRLHLQISGLLICQRRISCCLWWQYYVVQLRVYGADHRKLCPCKLWV